MGWITDKKPEKSGQYIVTTKYGEVWTIHYWEGVWNASSPDTKFAIEDKYFVAWMPMPKPYKGEETEDGREEE